MQEILEAGAQIINKAQPETLDQLADTKRSIRERALGVLTAGLDPKSEKDTLVFQVLPLNLLKTGDLMGAIWSMITMGNLGNTLSLKILSEIYQKAIHDREESLQSGDNESLRELDIAIESLFRMCQRHAGLKNTAEVRIMMGYHAELQGDPYKAIGHYDYAIGKRDITGYMASAKVYESLGQYQSSRDILEKGYELSSDTRILGELIALLCKMGAEKDAYLRYRELQQLDTNGVAPFIIYKGTIENDMELAVLENMIASYITDGSLIPYGPLVALTQSASEYVSLEISKLNHNIESLGKVHPENWNIEAISEYNEYIFQRLKLMQIDLMTLCNDRYLKKYIQDLVSLYINGSHESRRKVSTFFLENFSVEVEHVLQKRGGINTGLNTDKEDDTAETETVMSTRPNTVPEDIRWHLSRLGELFSQPEHYDIQRRLLMPTMMASEKQSLTYDDVVAEALERALSVRSNVHNNYFGLRHSIRANYENFIAQFDAKYGVFYRRHIQLIAIDPTVTPEKYPKMLQEYTDVALLFWMEQIIIGEFPTSNPEKIENLIEMYSLDQSSILNTLLFGSLIYGVSIEYALGFLADYPNMLDMPEAIYIITEGLRLMDASTQKKCIKDLHAIAQEAYGARGFFEHIRRTFADINRNNPCEDDIEMMLLSSGNIAILQKKETEQSLLNFQTASSEFGSLEGLSQLGDSLLAIGQYDAAMGYLEQALLQKESIVVIEKILYHAISAGKFDVAEQYIQHGLSKGYNMMNPLLALHLWQGKTESAFLQAISMIHHHQEIIDMPPGLMKLLFDTIDFEINTPELPDGNSDKMKIYASYIFARIHVADQILDPSLFIGHWQYISALVCSYEGDRLHELIYEILPPLIGSIDSNLELSPSDQSLLYINAHANKICMTYQYLLDNETDPIKKERLYMLMNKISEEIIVVLMQFPDSDECIEKYRMKIEFQEIGEYKRPNQEDRVPVGYVH